VIDSNLTTMYGNGAAASDVYRCAELMIFWSGMRVYLFNSNVKLSQTEWKILSVLVRSAGRSLLLQDIVDVLWGCGSDADPNNVRWHVGRIRKKIGDKWIETVHGYGYRWSVV